MSEQHTSTDRLAELEARLAAAEEARLQAEAERDLLKAVVEQAHVLDVAALLEAQTSASQESERRLQESNDWLRRHAEVVEAEVEKRKALTERLIQNVPAGISYLDR